MLVVPYAFNCKFNNEWCRCAHKKDVYLLRIYLDSRMSYFQPENCTYMVYAVSLVCRVPSATWKPGKPGHMNFICPGPERAWNLPKTVRKPGQNKKLSRKTWTKPGLLKIHNISILYWDKFCASAILERFWDLPFGATIVCAETWRMAFLTWTKPWIMVKNNWEPWVWIQCCF